MDKRIINVCYTVAILGLLVAGMLFLGISLSGAEDAYALPIALACIMAGNLLGAIRSSTDLCQESDPQANADHARV